MPTWSHAALGPPKPEGYYDYKTQGFATPPGAEPAPATTSGGYGGATGGYGGTSPQTWDPNPNMGTRWEVDQQATTDMTNPVWQEVAGDVVNYEARNATNPNIAPLMGTSWEPTAEMSGQVTDGGQAWHPNMANYMYGRNPYAAEADIGRARGMGEQAAAMGTQWANAGSDFAMGQAENQLWAAEEAKRGGLKMAEGVAAAGQNVADVGNTSAFLQRTIGNTQGGRGALLGKGLTEQGSSLGQGVSNLGQAAASVGGDYGAGAAAAGRTAATIGQSYGQNLASLEATEGPSGAQGLLNQQNNRAMNTQLALARSGRGMGGSAAAMSQAGQNIGAIQQEAGNQAAQLRAQENAAWRQRQGQNLAAGGSLSLEGQKTNLQGVTQGGALALEGQKANIGAAATGAGIAQQGAQAGAGLEMQGLAGQAASYAQGAGMAMQGAEAATAAQAQAAAIGQNAYGQQMAGYGQAANTGMAGFEFGVNTQLGAMEQQQAYEQYAQRIRELEMSGGLALEDKYVRDHAIRENAQAAENAARQADTAAKLNLLGTGIGTAATSFD